MALAFGVEFDPEDMSVPLFTHGFAPHVRRGVTAPPWSRPASFARKWLKRSNRTPARSALDASPETIRRENATIADAFGRIADIVGLTEDERSVLFGAKREPSRVILALETIGAALDLCGAPEATLDWLRTEIPQAPFNGRAPLTLFAADGQFGVEIALLYLRARLRKATRMATAAASCF
jgi:hypothetical protein